MERHLLGLVGLPRGDRGLVELGRGKWGLVGIPWGVLEAEYV